jgi:hypothetical protein
LIAERMLSPFGSGLKRSDFLAAFAGVRLAADPVHGNRKRGVRLARDRAERHGAGRKALDDVRGRIRLRRAARLALLVFGRLDPEQAAQRQQTLGLLVEDLREGAIAILRIAAHGMLQQRHRLGVPRMVFTAAAIGIFTADIERGLVDLAASPNASLWRRTASSAISARPTPSILVWVPAKYLVTNSAFRPTASKICAPQ